MARETYAKRWTVLQDGGSGTWLYSTPVKGGGFLFLEIMDLVDAMGGGAPDQWACSLAFVDPGSTDPDTIASAIDSCGGEDWLPKPNDPRFALALAECMHSYGAKSPLHDNSGGKVADVYNSPSEHSKAFRSLRAEARRIGEAYLKDRETLESDLDSKIVNAIGQTAREYANGADGLWVALRRIKDNPDATPGQKIVLGMYSKAKQTLGVGPVPADLVES